jgi:hypothetical protein
MPRYCYHSFIWTASCNTCQLISMYYIMITINVVHSEISVSGVENLQYYQLLIYSVSDIAFQYPRHYNVSVLLSAISEYRQSCFRVFDTEKCHFQGSRH